MDSWKWRRLKFTIFHGVIAAAMLAMSIVGMTLISWTLFAVGWLVILTGLLSFFPNLIIKIDTIRELGIEIIRTNLGERVAVLAVTVLIGAGIAQLPNLLTVSRSLGFIAIAAIALWLGAAILSENRRLCLYDGPQTTGKFVPLAYMAAGAVFMISGNFGAEAWLPIVAMVPAVAFHVYRLVYVFREGSF